MKKLKNVQVLSSPGHPRLRKPLLDKVTEDMKKNGTKIGTKFTIPVLRDRDGVIDNNKPWYIEFYFDGVRFKEKFQMNYIKDKAQRYLYAENYRRHLQAMLEGGFNPINIIEHGLDDMPIDFLIEDELMAAIADKKLEVAHKTWQSYHSSGKKFVEYCLSCGYTYLKDIKKSFIDRYDKHLQVVQKLQPKSRANEIGNISALFNHLIKKEIIDFNPCFGVKKTKKSSGKTQIPWTKEEYIRLKEITYEHHFNLWIFCNFVFYCGMRPKEVGLIRMSDIDLKNQMLIVNFQDSKVKHTDCVVIPNLFIEDLQRYCKNVPASYYLFSDGMLPGKDKKHRNVAQNHIRKYVTIPGKFTKGIYQLKHTAAVLMDKAGLPKQIIQRHFRHTSIVTTEIYLNSMRSHVDDSLKNSFPDIYAL